MPSTADRTFARIPFDPAGRRPDGLGDVIARYGPRLHGTARWIVGNPHDADDVVQDVFLVALQSPHLFKGDCAVFTWLYRITVNKAVSLKRRARRTVSLDTGSGARSGLDPGDTAEDTGPGADLERAELAGWVHAALRRLSGEHREVIFMKDFEGLPYGEIAAALGVPVGTVRSRLYRARLDLRYLLGLSPGEGSPPGDG